MGKKCIPGVLCIENMTLFVLILILLFSVYVYVRSQPKSSGGGGGYQPMPITVAVPVPVYVNNGLDDPRMPPMKTRNVMTSSEYSQIGILTKSGMILPLMGRRHMNGRDKWQYYTISNTGGNLNTKLPVSVKGKSCTSEYGCDEMMNGDSIYVEGYNDTFKATIYENNAFSYIPYL
jgi:hypothetical protein